MNEHYRTLGVTESDNFDDIKKVWKRLVKDNHPDVSKNKNATQNLQKINAAYEWLKKNHVKKTTHQKQTAPPKQPKKPHVIELWCSVNMRTGIAKVSQQVIDVSDVNLNVTIGNFMFRIDIPKGTKLPKDLNVRNQQGSVYNIRFVDDLPECMMMWP